MRKIYFLIYFVLFANLYGQTLLISEIMSSNSTVLADEDGDYSDWIEIYNPSNTIINIDNFSISDDEQDQYKWIFPDVDIAPYGFIIVFASGKDKIGSELHTNFKLKSEGEPIILSNSAGEILDQINATIIPNEISFGRNQEIFSEWLYFTNPSPGGLNGSDGFIGLSEKPRFSKSGGFYHSNVVIDLSTESELLEIYYTLDGSEPDENSTPYSIPIIINETKVVRAKSYGEHLLPSKTITHTFFINENISLPVVSLSTNPDNFWDDEIGIYVEGTNGIPGNCSDIPYNWNQDWERPVHIEFYEVDGTTGFSIDAGVKIYGGCTRILPQKSLEIKARAEYGSKTIPYKIFTNRTFEEFDAIILRSSGNDNAKTMMRDALMHTLVDDLDLENLAYRPAIVFLNGEYWGIHNIRERIGKNYISQYHAIDKDSLDLLESKYYPLEGSSLHYKQMYNYILNHDLSVDQYYNYVATQMDINNYINYIISEMYFANVDWFPNNTKFWRPKTNEGRWRWILYDTDIAFGFFDDLYSRNLVNVVTDTRRYPSIVFNGLIENESFKNQFVNTFADFTNSIFKAERVLPIIDSIKSLIELEMPYHIQKWSRPSDIAEWYENVQILRNFANNRLAPMKQHFVNGFGLDGLGTISIQVNNLMGGNVKLNKLFVDKFPWNGEYFASVPITLEALPKPGYEFIGWSGDYESIEKIIIVDVATVNSITANFQRNNLPPNIVINEINYNSNSSFEVGDWVELFNNTNESVNLSNWYFSDELDIHKFIIPENTILGAKDYLVLCENKSIFSTFFPGVFNVIGDFGFGLSGGGEPIRLYSYDQQLVDTVDYDDEFPWPIEADGSGPSLELKHPELNNLLHFNWKSSSNYGTPGWQNDSYAASLLEIELKVFLEGAYDVPNSMSTVISQSSVLPTSQPYSTDPWKYNGNESINNITNPEIIDWVLVALRRELTDGTNLIERAALLKKDGKIVELDGESSITFCDIPSGSYYIVVYHRNHLPVMSSTKINVN